MPSLPREHLERVRGFGGAQEALSWVHRPRTLEDVAAVFELARAQGLGVGLRGAGQSYGDASLATGGICLDLTRLRRVLDWDPHTGCIRVEPGVTIDTLWRTIIADGWWPPVVPGTAAVTLGGAVSMNIHGKNNWKVGPLGDHVAAFDLLVPSGECLHVSRDVYGDLFRAVIGGYGMLGVIGSVTLQMKRVASGLLDVEGLATRCLAEMLDLFETRMAHADYLVGWVDCFAKGGRIGRGLVHQARYLTPADDRDAHHTLQPAAQELPARLAGIVPRSLLWRGMRPLMNDAGMRLVNFAKFWQGAALAPHRFRQSHVAFAFLLDFVPEWRRAYGPGGLVQFQSFVPAARARETFERMIAHAGACGLTPYLGVLKRHRRDDFLLTHAVDGYSLALDFKTTPHRRARLWATCAELAQLVVEAGGRFYPAKDSTLDRPAYEASLGVERLGRFRALKRTWDPDDLLRTDFSRRVLGHDDRP
jgi:FAD/FMN-containing dehydrogenase